MRQAPEAYKLTPSDFAFLYRECPRCAWRKLTKGIAPPRSPMPSVFNKIDGMMKKVLEDDDTCRRLGFSSFATDVKVTVQSEVFWVAGVPFYTSGRIDKPRAVTDGSIVVLDNKCGAIDDKYIPQIQAYGWALQHPAKNHPVKVSKVGLVGFMPGEIEFIGTGATPRLVMRGDVTVRLFDYDDTFLARFAEPLAELIKGPEPAPGKDASGKMCPHCAFLEIHGVSTPTHVATIVPPEPEPVPALAEIQAAVAGQKSRGMGGVRDGTQTQGALRRLRGYR